MGPDLSAPALDADRIVEHVRTPPSPTTTLMDVLLDQRVAAGIGNVYKSETLSLMGLFPWQTLAHNSNEILRATDIEAARLQRANSRPGRPATRHGEDAAGILWIDRGKDRACHRCGTPIRRARLGRHRHSTYWCPQFQAVIGNCSNPSGRGSCR